MKTLKELLDQNPVVKATLYVLAATLLSLEKYLTKWKATPPENAYEVGEAVVVVLVAGVLALKTFTSNPSGKPDIK